MYELFQARRKYGSVYVTLFPDGTLVPWKPLSVQDFLLYTVEYQKGFIPDVILEDEIFCKAVQEPTLIRQFKYLKAGTVTVVVEQILTHSGPQTIEGFNEDLNMARQIILGGTDKVFHELTQLVTLAYPVTPEQVRSQTYEEFVLQFANAENKLLHIGHIKEPILIESPQQTPTTKKLSDEELLQQIKHIKPPKTPPVSKPKVDAKSLWEKQQKGNKEPLIKKDKKWYKQSPVLEVEKPTHNIDFHTESAEQSVFGLSGHEKNDEFIIRAKMIKDAQVIYKDLIENINSKKASNK